MKTKNTDGCQAKVDNTTTTIYSIKILLTHKVWNFNT